MKVVYDSHRRFKTLCNVPMDLAVYENAEKQWIILCIAQNGEAFLSTPASREQALAIQEKKERIYSSLGYAITRRAYSERELLAASIQCGGLIARHINGD